MKPLLPSVAAALLAVTLLAPAQQPPVEKPATKATPAPAPVAAPHKNVTPDQAEKLIQSEKDLVVVDVRTPTEFNEGHIAGAKNVSILEGDFEKQLKQFEGKPLLLHCASGTRSARALTKMRDLQFPEVYHMDAGIKGWKDAGKPVMKTPETAK